MRKQGITTYNLHFFFSTSTFLNFSTASKSSSKKFDTSPVGPTDIAVNYWYTVVYFILHTVLHTQFDFSLSISWRIFFIQFQSIKQLQLKRTDPIHCLRHSITTPLSGNGTDLRHIREWPDHENSKITEIYTHVSKLNFDKFINPLPDTPGKRSGTLPQMQTGNHDQVQYKACFLIAGRKQRSFHSKTEPPYHDKNETGKVCSKAK